jgi:predicted PurR-regulated permease PerM
MDQAKWQSRRDILISIICMGIIIWTVWNLVNQFIEAILLLLLAMTIAYLITPLVNLLEHRQHVPRWIATLFTYIVVIALVALVSYALVSSLIGQLSMFSKTIVTFTAAIPHQYSSTINFLKTRLGIPQERIDAAIGQFSSQVSSFVNTALNNIINLAFFLTNTIIDTLIVIIISFYLTLDGKRMRNRIINVVPKRSISNVLLFEDALTRVVGRYIRGQLTLAVIIGVLTSVVCAIFGLQQFAIIFGVLGFLFETIPMVGPFLASIAPILTSLLLPDPFPRTIFILVSFIVIQAIESNILGPRIVGHAVGLHPVVSIIALLIFTKLFGTAFGAFGGAIGALIATPIVAALWVVVATIYRSMHGETQDQIQARKQAPWSLKRPSLPGPLRRFSGPIKHKEAGEHLKNPSPNTIPLQPKSLEANQNQQEDAIHKEDN